MARHIGQPGSDIAGQNALEGELLTAGLDGSRHFMQLRSGQNKHQMGRRLFQDLQQRVECRGREHMDLVHNVHPFPHRRWSIYRLIPQGTNLVHAVVGGRIQLQHIQNRAILNAQTGRALVAGIPVDRVLTVDRPGQDFGAGSLACASGTCKQIGVRESSGLHLPLQRIGDMGLTHHVVKGTGPPFSV